MNENVTQFKKKKVEYFLCDYKHKYFIYCTIGRLMFFAHLFSFFIFSNSEIPRPLKDSTLFLSTICCRPARFSSFGYFSTRHLSSSSLLIYYYSLPFFLLLQLILLLPLQRLIWKVIVAPSRHYFPPLDLVCLLFPRPDLVRRRCYGGSGCGI